MPSLVLGWSVLEGIGAALAMPAMAALIASNYEGRDRVTAYGVLGGVAGAGIAIGPILGGYATTNLSWRVVFLGEVVVAIGIIAVHRWITDAPRPDPKPHLDAVGAVLSASGLVLDRVRDAPVVHLGLAQADQQPGGALRVRARPRSSSPQASASSTCSASGRGTASRSVATRSCASSCSRSSPCAQVSTLLAQNTILMGVFFTIPLYLQIVLGFDALETGIKMLPTSVVMFVVAFSGALLLKVLSPRSIIRIGLGLLTITCLVLMGTIEPDLSGTTFALGMALLGAGMGLLASQLGNVVLSSVDTESRSEAGGLQYTAQQLGSSIGVALIGSIVLTASARST